MLDRFFGVEVAGSSIRTEVIAGSTTFLTMAYILFVQPAVLTGALTGSPTGMDFGAIFVATCLAAALATAIMGIYARYPIAQAPGMGQNFFFVVSIVPAAAAAGHAEPWRAALGVVFVSGVLFLLLSLLGVRQLLMEALSPSMKSTIGAGIGVFIAFIGLQNATVVLSDPATAVRLNPAFQSPDVLIFFFGFGVTALLHARAIPGSILIGILTTLGAAILGRLLLPEAVLDGSLLATQFQLADRLVAMPPSIAPTLFGLDLAGALSLQLLPFVVLVLFMDLFDSIGTFVAVTQEAGLMRDGRIPRIRKALLSDAVGTVAGAALGTSTVTSYVESAAGVEQGGRTGLTAVVTAALFIVALPLAPLIAMVGSYPPITAPALLLVGAIMMRAVRHVEWDDATEAVPAFLTFIGIPLTYSIADGIALGLIAYPLMKIFTGRGDEANAVSKALGVLLVAYFLFVRSRIG